MNAFLTQLNDNRRARLEADRAEWAALVDLLEASGEKKPPAAAIAKAEGLLDRTGRTTADLAEALALRARRRELETKLSTKPAIDQRFAELGQELQQLADQRPQVKAEIANRLEKARTRQRELVAKHRDASAAAAVAIAGDVDAAVDQVKEIERELRSEDAWYQERSAEIRGRRSEQQQALRDLAEAQFELNRLLAAEQAALPSAG